MLSRRGTLAGAGAMLAGAMAPAHAQVSRPVVATTRNGRLRGLDAGGMLTFKGIRYGAAPARWHTPAPAPSWAGVRDATQFGAASPQRGEAGSEDCLFLNVWTPGLTGRRPVLVYIHGGAYATGSGSSPLTDGANLCRRGEVVVVTLNHRLNVFGYGYFNQLGAPAAWADSGNAGQLDLVLALRWVRDNIAAFGGDRECVTVFGQSGGGAKIATLMAMPVAAGLFHRAWTMSGQQVTASGPLNATRRARALIAALGVAENDWPRLAQAPADKLVAALATPDPVLASGSLYFGPVLDMRSLMRHPFYPDAPAQSHAIPMVLGNTLDETRAFLPLARYAAMTWAELTPALAPQLVVDIDPTLVVTRYREFYPAMTPTDVFYAATTAGRSWRAQIVEAEARAAANTSTWVYQMNWRSPVEGGRWGAAHGIDIPLAFANTAASGAITGDGADARAMAESMSDALLAFARNGEPRVAGAAGWPRYDLTARATMMFDLTPRVENDPRGAERRLFATVPYVQPGS